MVKKDVKIISTLHISNTVKWTHILHDNSYYQFSSGSHTRLLSVLFANFVNSADSVGHNEFSSFFCQILKLWDLVDIFENIF